MNETLGQIAYNSYCAVTGWKSLVSGAQLPHWSDVKPEIKAAWENAAENVARHSNPEVARLMDIIGQPPEGSHKDEWNCRAATWHDERQNWIKEVELLRRECAMLRNQLTDIGEAVETARANAINF